MSKNVYLGNLPFSATKEELIEFMHPHSPKTVTLITDRDTGNPKGFGFAEFATEEEGSKCINDLDGAEFGGRTLNVAMANPRPERREQSRDRGRNRDQGRERNQARGRR